MKPFLPEKVAYYVEKYRKAIHFILHALLWVFTCTLAFYTVPLAFKDNNLINRFFTVLIISQTLGYFYLMGYWVLPAYLYQFRPFPLLACSLLIFYLIYLSNYVSFALLVSYSDGINNPREYFIERWWNQMHANGLLGPFKNLTLAVQNFVFSLNVSFSYLVPKLIKDFITIRGRTVRLEIANLQLQQSYLKLELEFLRSQMNPHFLFNTLNSIYARIFTLDDTAADLVLRLSELMRYSLYEAGVNSIGLDQELSYIQNYLILEKNRLSSYPIDIQFQQLGQSEGLQIAPLILIVFVENAFKHGVKSMSIPGVVFVNAHINNNELTFVVSNSIVANRTTKTVQQRSGGIGLKNVNRRLENLYKDRYQLDVVSEPDRYTIKLLIKLEQSSGAIDAR
ncbi:histidine kinase [Spirosoma sp.]|uniref:sensor histidine kinase n=1 Tax=Spirosoma sp. TaxID=1899569 RepID=UPI00261B954D|nr:histidine kinase [Spirosoma sp.]MCX6212981.1 histidine kinase [Spirosoma sp.]